MPFLDSAIALMVSLSNPLLSSSYPRVGSVAAVIDTGYSGFLLIPEKVFLELKLDQLVTRKAEAVLGDGRRIELTGSYGSIVFERESLTVDGLIETNRDISEILIGMGGIRKFVLTIDSCRRETVTEVCAESPADASN